jgi:hypothetical protein
MPLHWPPLTWTTVSRWEVGDALEGKYPEKVVLAKLRRMIRRKLIDGCGCGCRGDLSVLPDQKTSGTLNPLPGLDS